MMNPELFEQIVRGIIIILSAIITYAVIPYIRSKVTAEQLNIIRGYAETAVRCAEQVYTPEQWKIKKVYVMNYLRDLINTKLHINITEAELDVLVESIVNEVKKQ